jgi:hypothetical protein
MLVIHHLTDYPQLHHSKGPLYLTYLQLYTNIVTKFIALLLISYCFCISVHLNRFSPQCPGTPLSSSATCICQDSNLSIPNIQMLSSETNTISLIALLISSSDISFISGFSKRLQLLHKCEFSSALLWASSILARIFKALSDFLLSILSLSPHVGQNKQLENKICCILVGIRLPQWGHLIPGIRCYCCCILGFVGIIKLLN